MKPIQIAGKWIGPGHPCFIIAEAGVNHNGDIVLAKKMIDVAADAGADAVKFQTFHAEDLVTQTAEKADYQKITTDGEESQFDMLKELELPENVFYELSAYAAARGIIFLSTPFDEKSANLLEGIDVPAYKISSGDITNFPLLKVIAEKRKPVILSTGMSTLGEVEEAVFYLQENGIDDIIVLHCTTSYPAPVESVNLRAMETMRVAFNVPVGYSDHTEGTSIPIAAVAMGANVIEKHFTLNRTMDGPDHAASIEPDELGFMVKSIRGIEKSIGDGIKKTTKEEQKTVNLARRYIVIKNPIKSGDILTYDKIAIKRSHIGIQPKYLDKVVGMRVNKNMQIDQSITWDDLEKFDL